MTTIDPQLDAAFDEVLSIRWGISKIYGFGGGNKGAQTWWEIPDDVRKEAKARLAAIVSNEKYERELESRIEQTRGFRAHFWDIPAVVQRCDMLIDNLTKRLTDLQKGKD